jgi:hypothetical protein
MKRLIIIYLLLMPFYFLRAQDHKRWMIPVLEFSEAYITTTLFQTDSLYGSNGVFGNNYARIQIVFTQMIKGRDKPAIYNLKGASRHLQTVTPFSGELVITKVYQYPGNFEIYQDDPDRIVVSEDIGDELYTVIEGNYILREDSTKKYSGVFKGTFKYKFHQHKNGQLVNDLREWEGLFYSNKIFTGSWTSYTNGKAVPCNWAEGRIPVPEGVDVGETEFEVAGMYEKNGWQKNSSGDFVDHPERWWLQDERK